MFTPRTAGRVFADGFPRTIDYRPLIAQIFFCSGGRVGCGCPPRLNSQLSSKNPQRSCDAFTLEKRRERPSAFTLLELLIVISIVAVLLVLIAPAFTTIKGGTDVTSAAYTIKGVLDTARTYAKANKTYTWVGFFEEDISNPPNAGIGRIVMSIVASKDGTKVYDPNSLSPIDPTKLIQVGKLTKIDNAHLAGDAVLSANPLTPTGPTFDYRPAVTYRIASPPNSSPADSATPFQYPVGSPAPAAQYTFLKVVQFSPGGEARIDNTSYPLQTAAEIGIRPTHGMAVDTTTPNVVAIQFGGLGGDVVIYRK
jgi:prepilin-type N-terminal cleavage/methylation domain-containing protein